MAASVAASASSNEVTGSCGVASNPSSQTLPKLRSFWSVVITPPGPIEAVASSVCDSVSRLASTLCATSSTDTSSSAADRDGERRCQFESDRDASWHVRFLGEIR